MITWFAVILIILIGVQIWIKLNWGKIKGAGGERFIRSKLNRLDPDHYIILNDLMIPSSGNSATTQIDHIVVSNYGIFVIETKDYDGWIFGNAKQEYWTRVIYKYKDRIRNPLWQNYGHVKAVENLLNNTGIKVPIIPFVAFPVTDKLKISGTDCVGCGRDLINKILSFKQEVITNAERDKITSILEEANIEDKEARKQHIKNVKELNRK